MKANIREIINQAFPQGTMPISDIGKQPSILSAPIWPPDAYGIAAMLLERSGVYQFLSPGRIERWSEPWFILRDRDVQEWHDIATEWRSTFAVPSGLQCLWDDLLDNSDASISKFPGLGTSLSKWVRCAYALMFVADEASKDIGYVSLDSDPKSLSWVNLLDAKLESEWISRNKNEPKSSSEHILLSNHRYTIAQMLSQDMLAVQPKARTPQVGATLRTMSQHLALLPPPARIGATWQRIASHKSDEKSDLNILLIPFPYRIECEWFSGLPDGVKNGSSVSPKNWGWFDLEQRWLPDDPAIFTQFVESLIKEAESEKPDVRIDAVILPEYSLTWEHHQHLVEHLASTNDEIEFIVSGSKTNCEGAEGNFALTSSINRVDLENPIIHTNSRGKHHRWRLDSGQIEAYGLSSELDPSTNWWEGIALHRRQVHTHVFRESSSFTTFICEDLARSDPCHETIRALGPSIVFCLLMDNVQIPVRWPGRYAAALAEDPGSAVLTFTSRGLIENAVVHERRKETGRNRSQKAEGSGYARSANWSIGLWRDDETNFARELHCPPGEHAVLLRLERRVAEDASYDDRCDSEGVRWVYSQSLSIGLDESHPALSKLQDSKLLNPAR